MQPFRTHTGLVATLDRANVDTDQIIPKQFLKRIERTGFGQFLFFDWRYLEDGTDNPDFELNRPARAGRDDPRGAAQFRIGLEPRTCRLGCSNYGFRAVIAPSFADIFFNNSFKNGLLPIRLDEATVERIFAAVAQNPGYQLTVDLEQCRVRDGASIDVPFTIDAFRRHMLLEGLDEIALTLQHEDKIAAFEQQRVCCS